MLRYSPLVLLLSAVTLTAACAPAVVSSGSPPGAPTTSGSRVFEESFFSPALGVRKHAMVYLPPSYGRDTTRRYPVAYYLHGLSGAEADWVAKGGIDMAADSLFAAGAPEMIIVMPDGDDGWYTTWTRQFSFRSCADTLRIEAPDRHCVERQRYDEYIARDVVAFVDGRYRTLPAREHRGIAGLSMGGYGALSLALHFPDVFSAAASHSGVLAPLYTGPRPFAEPARFAATVDEVRPTAGGFWPRYLNYWGTDLGRWHEADLARTAEALQRRRATMPALFIDCGVDDGFIDQNRALHSELTRMRIEHAYKEWPGAHSWRYWSTHVRESLAWMGTRIAR